MHLEVTILGKGILKNCPYDFHYIWSTVHAIWMIIQFDHIISPVMFNLMNKFEFQFGFKLIRLIKEDKLKIIHTAISNSLSSPQKQRFE